MRGIALAALAALTGCSQVLGLHDVSVNDAGAPDGDAASSVMSYVSTSTVGELARWDISGNMLSVTWEITDATGQVTRTLMISALCGDPDATYGSRSCTVASATCTGPCAAGDAPPTGAVYTVLELPGVALAVVGPGGGRTVFHVGLARNPNCPGPGVTTSEFVTMDVAIAHPELFAVSRVTTGFSPFIHADFRMGPGSCTSSTPTGGCTSTPAITYTTQTSGTESVTSSSCASGIQTAIFGSGLRLRVMSTGPDAPAITVIPEFRGAVSFPVAQAATLSDFASKTLVGILHSPAAPVIRSVATTGPVSATGVAITSIRFDSQLPFIGNAFIAPAVNATSKLTSPSFPNFTAAPVGAYTANALQPAYSSVSKIPGMFVNDGDPSAGNDHSRLIVVAGKMNGKLVGIGASYDWANNVPGYAGADYLTVGMFVLFEKP
jgi:hypothetical protein